MQLPDSWVESLFARFAVRYGAAWIRQWEGVDIAAVKADWAEQLGGTSSGSIKHALEHLPVDKPPTVGQFQALCRNAPRAAPPALPAPKADPAVVAAALGALQRPAGYSPKGWAYRLQKREEDGDRLTNFQRSAWRDALGVSAPVKAA